MGDLRNKVANEIRDARVRAMQKRMEAQRPKPIPVRCKCGNVWPETPQWQVGRDIYCPACLPKDLMPLVIFEVANMPEGPCRS